MKSKPSPASSNRRSDMKRLLTTIAVLAAVATPALAQSSAERNAAARERALIERSVPANGQSNYSPFGPGDIYGGGAS
jgi:hypothetical protein